LLKRVGYLAFASFSPAERQVSKTNDGAVARDPIQIRIGAATEWRRTSSACIRASGREARRGQLRGARALCDWPGTGAARTPGEPT